MIDRGYGLYLRGLVLADVQARADSADTGHSPGLNVGGGQFSGGVPCPFSAAGSLGTAGTPPGADAGTASRSRCVSAAPNPSVTTGRAECESDLAALGGQVGEVRSAGVPGLPAGLRS